MLTRHSLDLFQTFFFDFDGVIVDSESVKFRAYQKVFSSQLGIQLPDGVWGWMGRGEFSVVQYWANHFDMPINKELAQDIVLRKRAAYEELVEKEGIPLIQGIRAVLTSLKERGRTAVLVTGSPRATVFKMLAGHGLSEYFKDVITSDDGFASKPDPEPYLRALERVRADRASSLGFEDSEAGLLSLKSAGIPAVAVGKLAHRFLGTLAEHYVEDFLMFEGREHVAIET